MPSPPQQLISTGGHSQMGGLSLPIASLPAAAAAKHVGRANGPALTMCMPAGWPPHQRAVAGNTPARLTSSPRRVMADGVAGLGVSQLARPLSPGARPASLVASAMVPGQDASFPARAASPHEASRSARAASPVPVIQAAAPVLPVSSPVAQTASTVTQPVLPGTPVTPGCFGGCCQSASGTAVTLANGNETAAAENTGSETAGLVAPGNLYRVACKFEAIEGDATQLSLARDDLVYVQCHDPSGWTYGRLECTSEQAVANRASALGTAGWFPSALLASYMPLGTVRTRSPESQRRSPDDIEPELAPEPQTTARSTTTLLLSPRSGTSTRCSSAQNTARNTAPAPQPVSAGDAATPVAPAAEKEQPDSSRPGSHRRRKPTPTRGASWSPGRGHRRERQELPAVALRISAEGGVWEAPTREVSPARLRYERLRAESSDDQDRLQKCEKLLYDTAILQQRQLGMLQSAGRSTCQAEEAVEHAERLLAAMEMQEKRCRAEASCVASSSSSSLRQGVQSRLYALEAKKEAALMNLQAAKQRLEYEKMAFDAVRDQMRSEREAAVAVVEGLAQHRMRVNSASRERLDSYSDMLASAHPSSGSRHQSPQSTRCPSPMSGSRQPCASPTLHAREEAMDSTASTLKQRPRHVGAAMHRQGSSPRLSDETSSASSRSSASGFKTPGFVPVGFSAAGAPPPRACPVQSNGRTSKKHRTQSHSPTVQRGRKGQHTRTGLTRAPSRETLGTTTSVNYSGRSQSPIDRNGAHADPTDGAFFNGVVQNGGKAYAQSPGLPQGATEEELTHMLDVLRTAEVLQAKLAAMPDHLRLPLARWLSADESANAEPS
mmetsp:Transcript_142821/g.252102  ORF Transcript_142821/g.252102 Transcript_142821/m.252102 type:complete len:837 (+) Transcript_142821:46-2556(+)